MKDVKDISNYHSGRPQYRYQAMGQKHVPRH